MELLAILSPLFAAVVAGLGGRVIGHKGCQVLTCAAMTVAAVCSVLLFQEVALQSATRTVPLFTWIASGGLVVDWALRFDQLSVVMVLVVNLVSCAVHFYSIGYMSHDESRGRFMAYLSLFTFAMLMLVTADNFLQLFFGWEGVGLASYLLIGFWNHKDSANDAAIKAFVVNRVGDFGLVLGVMGIFFLFGTLDFNTVFQAAPAMAFATMDFLGVEWHALSVICLLLFIGAMGKSAQLGLHVWLPDAMEGPTPVSALIHAATMVTAGVFLLARMSPLFEMAPDILAIVAVMGALTALVAATIGLTQFDIKRVIAYSTMSQLGYMFFALGVSAYGAAIFHLFTHAFFKALLFLGAGSVIHAMSGEQDMRNMGGIWRHIRKTYAMMWIGSLALAGIPLFAGYYSKDIVLEAAFAAHSGVGLFAYWCGIAAAVMTAFYSWRLLFMTFHGAPRADEKVMAHVHESPAVMMTPLYALAVGAVASGFAFKDLFVGEGRDRFWGESLFVLPSNDTLAAAHHVAPWVALLPTVAAVLGIALAYFTYIRKPGFADAVAARFPRLHALFFHKWYFDELFALLVTGPARILARGLWRVGDVEIIDGFGPNGLASLVRVAAQRLSALQTGFVYHYAFAMLAGVVFLLGLYVLRLAF